jgi:hypothetical protein
MMDNIYAEPSVGYEPDTIILTDVFHDDADNACLVITPSHSPELMQQRAQLEIAGLPTGVSMRNHTRTARVQYGASRARDERGVRTGLLLIVPAQALRVRVLDGNCDLWRSHQPPEPTLPERS